MLSVGNHTTICLSVIDIEDRVLKIDCRQVLPELASAASGAVTTDKYFKNPIT